MADKHNKNTMDGGAVLSDLRLSDQNSTVSSDPRLSDQGGADRINNISFWLKRKFGRKMIKLSIDGGFTCPNRDGTVGTGGCLFCGEGAGGDFASDIDSQIRLYQTKWPDAGYIAYFQNHTNTYAPVRKSYQPDPDASAETSYGRLQIQSDVNPQTNLNASDEETYDNYPIHSDVNVLRDKYYSALSDPRISGIAIATRPDCLGIGVRSYNTAAADGFDSASAGSDILDLLSEINKEHFMWVELGLQTASDRTAELINRCYPTSVYDDAMDALNSRGIKTVTHLILGLPGETEADMRASVEHAVQKNTWGIKLHMLNVVRGSRLAVEMPDYVPFQSIDEYVDLVCDLIEIIPPEITIHRLTADAPRSTLIAPEWSYQKRTILNSIHAELRRRGSFQGSSCTPH